MAPVPPRDPDEFALIARHFAPLARSSAGALGLLDDAALLDVEPGRTLVLAADMAIEGVHFLASDPPATIGRKVLRYNLSDLAAMGAKPLGYLLTVAAPEKHPDDWLAGVAEGLRQDQDTFGLGLLGGDTTATPGPAMLSIAVVGSVGEGGAVLRSGGRPGDAVFVSGTIGDGRLGLRALKGELDGLAEVDMEYLQNRYRLPEPRLGLGQALVGFASAAIDVSDGLIADLGHICETSHVGAVIEAARLPLSSQARKACELGAASVGELLSGGDDYELLFCLPEDHWEAVGALERAGGIAVTQIGSIVAGTGVEALDADGKAIVFESGGYRHF